MLNSPRARIRRLRHRLRQLPPLPPNPMRLRDFSDQTASSLLLNGNVAWTTTYVSAAAKPVTWLTSVSLRLSHRASPRSPKVALLLLPTLPLPLSLPEPPLVREKGKQSFAPTVGGLRELQRCSTRGPAQCRSTQEPGCSTYTHFCLFFFFCFLRFFYFFFRFS
jgi:hypothetical protein